MMWLLIGIGSTIGGFVPNLWGAGFLSAWGIIFSGIGAIAGILAYNYFDF